MIYGARRQKGEGHEIRFGNWKDSC
jgi:hypothetical protein